MWVLFIKKIIKLLTVLSFIFPFAYTPHFSANENQITNSNVYSIENKDKIINGYQRLIFTKSSISNFLGRVLKSYYSNNIIMSNDNYLNLRKILEPTLMSEESIDLIIQNFLASTINISGYGITDDAEFFAEAFAKWLQTPDDQKNISWEITNDFFINVLPTLLSSPLDITNQNDVDKIYKLIIDESYNDSIEYRTESQPPTDYSVDLKYSNSIFVNYWASSSFKNIKSIINNYNDVKTEIAEDIPKNIFYIIQTWTKYSYTKSSQDSIDSFSLMLKSQKHFSSFEALNDHLLNWSIDKNGQSRINLQSSFDELAEKYEYEIPESQYQLEKWTDEKTILLKQETLMLYNVLYFLIRNEAYVSNLLIGIVVSYDYPLIYGDNNMENVMAYTITSTTKESKRSTIFSYVVYSSLSFLYKDFNSVYTSGFWSSPTSFSALFHEFGHALDYYVTKNESSRNSSQKDVLYSEMYKGNILGETYVYNFFSKNILFIVSSILVVLALISFIILLLINENKQQKNGSNKRK